VTRSRRLRGALALAALFVGVTSAGKPARADGPTTGDCLTANETSLTLRNRYELRAARAQLLICSAESCPADIRNECIRGVGDVNQAMPTIVFEARDAQGRSLLAVSVKMDGEPLARRLEGTALSIDPGQHTFAFEVAGQRPLEKQLLILEGEKDRRERVVFDDVGRPAPAAASQLEERASAGSPIATARARLGAPRLVSLALAGVGAAGLAVGTGFAFVAISRRDTAQAACPDRCADWSGVDLWNRARAAGDVATVGFLVGAAGLASGLALWFIAKPDAEPASRAQVGLGFGLGYAQVSGRW
jgi:hypothetical protein